jgi:NO-binding membrane sensor protein with MHYT domain
MFENHDPWLVALSIAVAILGGYTGFGLAARVRGTPGVQRRALLAAGAWFLAVGIWTMHFVGMLAAPTPPDAAYLVLPTLVSFLICALVVGISLYFVSIGPPTIGRRAFAALFMGLGIISMHYVGIHGVTGSFEIHHRPALIALAAIIAITAAFGGLSIYVQRQDGLRLAASATAFGIAVSGMHYTAMAGMIYVPSRTPHHAMTGLAIDSQVLAVLVAILCFIVTAGWLLFLVPEPRRGVVAAPEPPPPADPVPGMLAEFATRESVSAHDGFHRPLAPGALPLRGAGQPRPSYVRRVPVEGLDGIQFVDVADIRSIQADGHYTLVFDGERERMSPWSISEMEARLDPGTFLRIHRSHIVSIEHVAAVHREGDGAIVDIKADTTKRVPVARARVAELRARLGIPRRTARIA